MKVFLFKSLKWTFIKYEINEVKVHLSDFTSHFSGISTLKYNKVHFYLQV